MTDNQSRYQVYLRTGDKVGISAERWETDGFAHLFLDGSVKKGWFSYADVAFVVRGDPVDVSKS